MAETNFELSVKAEDQCAVEDQGVAKAKLQPRLLRLAMSFRGKGLTQRTVVRDTKTRVKSVAAMCDPGCGKGYDNKNAQDFVQSDRSRFGGSRSKCIPVGVEVRSD